MRLSRRTTLWASIVGALGVAGILIGLNMLADARLATQQADWTQGRIYTLSSGTRTVLAGLKQPVTLRLFYSPALGQRLPSYGAYADRVREMLRQFAAVSHGMVRLEFYNPEPFSDTEDRAMAYGLQGVPVDQSGEQVFFGIAGSNLLDDERQIAFLRPEREGFLEYDLTRLVYELSNPTQPVVGVMTSLPLDGDPRMMMMQRGAGGAGGPWASMLLLRQSFNVKNVATDAQVIDPDIQVLLVAQAQHLTDPTLYAIDQFVMRGGRLMVMVDPDSEAESATPGPNGEPPTDVSSDLKKLFDAWGIVYSPDVVVGDLTGAWRVRAQAGDRVQAVDYVAWFNIRAGINKNDPATADLQQVTVASAGQLARKDGAPIEFTPLLSTDREAATIPAGQVRSNPDPAKILATFKPDGKAHVVAARVRGVLHSAFSGPPPLPPGVTRAANLPAYKAETSGPANLVVVADSDILADRFWVQSGDFFGQQDATPFSDNGPFVANLIGTLAGGDALIGLRSRGESIRPFTLVDNMQALAEARFRQSEQALQTHLDDVQKKLSDLRSNTSGTESGGAVITPEQSQAIEAAQRDIIDTRGQLRRVQLDLRRDISNLETELRVLDIAAVPVLLTLLAIGLGIARRRRRARARRSPA
jgi:ABC-type uncharacterized transport system involved in gliding motility auxiliary subunit